MTHRRTIAIMAAMTTTAAGMAGAATPTAPSSATPLPTAAATSTTPPPSPSKGAAAAVTVKGKSGGPRTVFLPSPNNPLVALRVFFHVGSVDDPAGKEGWRR